MELNQALKIVLELAEQNMLDTQDPELQEEMYKQFNAVETVRMHMQELENPSPLQVVIVGNGLHVQEVYTNVPAEVTTLDEDLEGCEDGSVRLFHYLGSEEYYPRQETVTTDPQAVADILREANA